MITMLVLSIPVNQQRAVSMTTLLIVMITTPVLPTGAIALPDVSILIFLVMTIMLVPMILVILQVVANMHPSLVMMMIFVQLILVVLLMDVNLLLKSVTI
jgi:hypothetical protein